MSRKRSDRSLGSLYSADSTTSSVRHTSEDHREGHFTAVKPLLRWLVVAALAPAAIWAGGQGLERLWFGPESSTATERAVATARQKIEQQYRTLFNELSGAAEIVVRRPDLLRTADRVASRKALFDLAASAIERLRSGEDRVALTIYDSRDQPVAWAGHPSDRPAIHNASAAFRLVAGPAGIRMVREVPVAEGRTRLGAVTAERMLASGERIENRYLETFDFTQTAAGLPIEVTYLTSDTGAANFADSRTRVVIRDPADQPVARVTFPDGVLEPARQYLRTTVQAIAGIVAVVGLLGFGLTVVRTLQHRGIGRIPRLVGVVAILWGLRLVTLWTDIPLNSSWRAVFDPTVHQSPRLAGVLRSPADFGLTGAAVLGTAFAALSAFEWLKRRYRHRRLTLGSSIWGYAAYSLIQAAIALLAMLLVIGYERFVAFIVASSTIDLLHFSFHPWSASRVTLQVGLMAFHTAATLLLVLLFRIGLLIARRPGPRQTWLAAQLALWAAAVVVAQTIVLRRVQVPFWPSVTVFGAAALSAYYADKFTARLRRRSASVRLGVVFVAIVMPSLLWSLSTTRYSNQNKKHLIEAGPAQQTLRQQATLLSALRQSLTQIDALDVADPTFAAQSAGDLQAFAFRLWRRTELADRRLTSAVEVYDGGDVLVSRFALNLPSYRLQQVPAPADVAWHLSVDDAASGSPTQRTTSASRGVFADGRRAGTIVVRVAQDYDTLPFISSQKPYFELFRSAAPEPLEATVMRDIELAVFDWQRRPIYASTRPAWLVDEELLQRIREEPRPVWTTLIHNGARDEAFVFWDPEHIYVIGYSSTSWWEFLLDVAELIVLVGTVYIACVLVLTLVAWAFGYRTIWPMRLASEVHTSFYGKLVLAFAAASTAPMVILSLSVHAQFVTHVRAEEEAAAQANVTVAKRVVEGYEASGRTALVNDDDVMVWIRSLVGQDVNVFTSGRLVATSQRDLFSTGLLPPLASGPVYRAIALDGADQYVGDERIGSFSYMLAAAPIRFAARDSILTVPFALQRRAIDTKIDELDRGLLLATLVFVIAAAWLGYRTADRLASPIGRLTRATHRLGRGDFQPLPTTIPGDEMQRLVGAFNRMAADLKAQRKRLEQTTRAEASAEMARRVAHDIKNPLTPVQLSAEHLLRVAADQGQAPRNIVELCVENILRQVRTLREIATEFSAFGMAPSPRPEAWSVVTLLEEIAASYQSGPEGRVALTATAPADLPHAFADRLLVARALTNVVENALHAIPDRGRIVLRGLSAGDQRVAIEVVDTGRGIDPEVLPRIFEPYFSTRTGGTGLGMAIVKRNIEANAGTIDVMSTPGQGTCVRVVLPAAADSRSTS